MMTETSDCHAGLRAPTEGRDALVMQSESVRLLTELIRGVDIARLTARPAPGKWSIREILAHLAEDELTTAWRYRQMIENPGVALAGFDQDLWARLGDYSSWAPEDALQMFRLLRTANLRMLAGLTPQQWECHGMHAERGRISVQSLAEHMAGHDRKHIDQIAGILGKS
jgi:DinB superfamily